MTAVRRLPFVALPDAHSVVGLQQIRILDHRVSGSAPVRDLALDRVFAPLQWIDLSPCQARVLSLEV